MTIKKRSIKRPKTAMRQCSAQHLAIRYMELLRLRQAVRQAELKTGRLKAGVDLQNKATYAAAD